MQDALKLIKYASIEKKSHRKEIASDLTPGHFSEAS
jgi:hypothetical protein